MAYTFKANKKRYICVSIAQNQTMKFLTTEHLVLKSTVGFFLRLLIYLFI